MIPGYQQMHVTWLVMYYFNLLLALLYRNVMDPSEKRSYQTKNLEFIVPNHILMFSYYKIS